MQLFAHYRLVFASLFIFGCFSRCTQEAEEPNMRGLPVRMTFLHTSDIHSRLVPYDIEPNLTDNTLGIYDSTMPIGGAGRLAYLVKRERQRAQRVMHVDSGDCFQGAPIYNANVGEVEIKLMSLLSPDAVVVGNHEFDSGVKSYVNQYMRFGGYTNLAANYVFPDYKNPNNHQMGKITQPYSIYNVDGLKIAVIGMANLSSLNSIGEGGNSLQLMPLEQNSILRHYVEFLHPLVDLVVVVSHLGLEEDEELVRGYENTVRADRVEPDWEIIEPLKDGNVRVFIPGIADIDVIFGGHLHIVLNPPKVVEDPKGQKTLIVHSGAFAKFLGRLDTMVEDNVVREQQSDGSSVEKIQGKKIVAHKYQAFPVDGRLADKEDAQVVRMIQPYLFGLNRAFDLKRYIGYAPKLIPRNVSGEKGDSPLGNLVAEAMRQRRRVEAEFALTNTLGIRDNIYPGPVTLEQMFNIFPFENTVTVMYLSGIDVQDLFDYATERSASRACQPQAQIAGITYIQNCAQAIQNYKPDATYVNPAQNVRINGQSIVPTQTYKLATNDYIAKGGSGFQVLRRNTQKFDTGVSLRDALIDYIQTLDTCSKYIEKTGVCKLMDADSKKLCQELQTYADLPCIDALQDGRITRVFVLGDELEEDNKKTDGDQGGAN